MQLLTLNFFIKTSWVKPISIVLPPPNPPKNSICPGCDFAFILLADAALYLLMASPCSPGLCTFHTITRVTPGCSHPQAVPEELVHRFPQTCFSGAGRELEPHLWSRGAVAVLVTQLSHPLLDPPFVAHSLPGLGRSPWCPWQVVVSCRPQPSALFAFLLLAFASSEGSVLHVTAWEWDV